MNILFLEGDMSRKGGTERMSAILANELCKKNVVYIMSLCFVNKEVFFELNNNVKFIVMPQTRNKLIGLAKQIKYIRSFIIKNHIDYVINVDIGMCIYGITSSWFTRAKVITWEHSNYYNDWNSRIFHFFRYFAFKRSNAMVVLTEQDRNNYSNNINSDKPIFVIHNPIRVNNYSYDIDSKIILSVGSLSKIKCFDLAVKTAKIVLNKYPEWKWIICGDGDERKYLETLIYKAGLQERVILTGNISNIDLQYQKASIYVMTSRMEGLPMVLLEAKSWGLPLVSFDIMTGPHDIIKDGVNGFLVPFDNITLLSKKIETLINDKEMRKQFSINAKIDIEKFDINYIIHQWNEVFRYLKKN